MKRFYFQFMSEGGGTASCSAAFVEAEDFPTACLKFIQLKRHSFYGGVGRANTPEEALAAVLHPENHTIHGAREVPEFLKDSEIWKHYENDDVTGFPPASWHKATTGLDALIEHSTGFWGAVKQKIGLA